MSKFQKAQRKQAKLKLAITGPSGSGKTYSALRLAKGIGGKIAMIDTENGSAALYADRFDFDILEMEPPYTTEKYIAAIHDAVMAEYNVIVVDQISHAWRGTGGLLDQKEQLDGRGGNSFTNWASITKKHEKFLAAILQTKAHMVCTMRSKQEYILAENNKGKQAPQKVGMAPVQREGVEYEFTTVFDIGMNHTAECSKDRSGLFMNDDGTTVFQITEETGETLIKWMGSGKEDLPGQLFEQVQRKKWTPSEAKSYMALRWKKMASADLTDDEIRQFLTEIKSAKNFDDAIAKQAPKADPEAKPDPQPPEEGPPVTTDAPMTEGKLPMPGQEEEQGAFGEYNGALPQGG